MHELSKSFIFEAAHTLDRAIYADGSRRIHGHSYRAQITLRGTPDQDSGMLMDLGVFQQAMHKVQSQLDHHLLDDVPNLGPATLENLCSFIWRALQPQLPLLHRVQVSRDLTGEICSYQP